jgi:hypothetical protein
MKEYYLSLDKVVLKNSWPSITFVKDESLETPVVSLDTNTQTTTVSFSSSCTYESLSQYIILKENVNGEESLPKETDKIDIEPGVYRLYNKISVNNFDFALAPGAVGLAITQHVIKSINQVYIDKESIENKVITILVPFNFKLADYISGINGTGAMYVLGYDKENYQITSFNCLQTVRANKISINSRATIPVLHEALFIDAADYITALIMQLQKNYPEVQFYNYEPAQNDSKFNEFVFYKANPEAIANSIHTTVVFSDPIYGDIQRSICNVEFEYFTHDIVKFNKRRFDFSINRFISNNTTATLNVPDTEKSFTFCVVWNREDVASDSPHQKTLQLSETNKSQLSFRFVASLTVTIYRLRASYPKIVTKILEQYVKKGKGSYKLDFSNSYNMND